MNHIIQPTNESMRRHIGIPGDAKRVLVFSESSHLGPEKTALRQVGRLDYSTEDVRHIVLSYCRTLHDLHTGYAGSKPERAEGAKSALVPSWSELIDGFWDGRPNPARKVQQPADPGDFENTLIFVKYVMNESRRYAIRK